MLGNIIKNALIAVGTATVVDSLVRSISTNGIKKSAKFKSLHQRFIMRDAASLMKLLEADPNYVQQVLEEENELYNSMRNHPAGKGFKSEEDILGDS